MMGSVNVSEEDVKVLREYDCLQAMKECHLTVEPFGDAIELGMRRDMFGGRVLQLGVSVK
jgi:hypothetical protein